MRSFEEIRFRLRQELVNARLLAAPPSLPPNAVLPDRVAGLPAPESFLARLRGSDFEREIADLAESICAHRFRLLGYLVETGPEIRWRRDYVNRLESGTEYFRRIPYLDPKKAGDHKVVWELNRHQHLVALAQGWKLTGRREFLEEIPRQIESWNEQNPFLRGVNWTSALEVAFRALSWIWIYHLAGPDLAPEFRSRLAAGIFQHGVYLENNLSVYFSPNTHLLGEAVALHAIGASFPGFPGAARWRAHGGKVVTAEMANQVRADGSHFEQSSAYHVYALDFFLFHALIGNVSSQYREKLRRMADYLAALSAADGSIPLLGDDDGGNLFYPQGSQRRYGARTLASCCTYFDADDWPHEQADLAAQAAWWMGEGAFTQRGATTKQPAEAELFPDAGVAVLSKSPAHIVVDIRGFGHANAGHSHAHALSVICQYKGRDVLIDPGTYTYTGEPEWRARFRGTAFHNTLRVDGLDQATGTGPFRWAEKPVSKLIRWIPGTEWRYLHAACAYRGLRHERHLVWIPGAEVLVAADVLKATGSHRIEQFWHCGEDVTEVSPGVWSIGSAAVLATPAGSAARIAVGETAGWQSEVPGKKTPRPAIVIARHSGERQAGLPVVMGAILFLQPSKDVAVTVEANGEWISIGAGNGRRVEIRENNDPIVRWEPV